MDLNTTIINSFGTTGVLIIIGGIAFKYILAKFEELSNRHLQDVKEMKDEIKEIANKSIIAIENNTNAVNLLISNNAAIKDKQLIIYEVVKEIKDALKDNK